MTVLDDIVERTQARLKANPLDTEELRGRATLAARRHDPHAFARALSQDGISVIAEIKAASPSAGSIVENPDVEAIARDYRDGGAHAISVVTEPEFFHGNRNWLRRAGAASGLPVIMKDFVVDEGQLLEGVVAGADAVLLLASLLDAGRIRRYIEVLERFGCDALVEVHDEKELARAVKGGARLIGVNNRDLRNFNVDLATSERLAPKIPAGTIKVAESGIREHADVERLRAAAFDAFLVGESLLRQNDRAAAVRRLRGGDR